jgi:hypothetical protein
MKPGIWWFVILSFNLSGSYAQKILPYLQSPTSSSVWVTWKTDSVMRSTVDLGEDSVSLLQTFSGSCVILSDAGYDSNYYYHSVRLTGLEPEHIYYYRAVTGTEASAIYRFKTQPPTALKTGTYRFLILGDHQIINSDRYERLMRAAREKAIEKYGGRIEDNISLIINDGDQVNEETLDQYEHVHFIPSSVLSGNIPIMTTVGNHETYGSLGLPLYYSHFFYDDLGYRGIVSPGGENYYSYQEKNLVFIHLSSEHPGREQTDWVQQIIDSVKTDSSVEWVVSVAHRPIQAEQYVGDISVYIRDEIIPVLTQTEKSVLLVTGHHHLYARGQVRDFPMYHIISGAASWDQYWGQSNEKDFDDVQKTIDYWTYQIASFNSDNKEMTVESYAIGSPKLGFTLDNVLIDSFYRKQGLPPPHKPSITTVPEDSITLPYSFTSSGYSSGTSEPYNSVQFQISSLPDFRKNRIDLIRDYEDLFGTTGDPDYKPVDVNKNVNIFRYDIEDNKLPNGSWFIRTRHRDRNIAWSAWSDPVKFTVKGSTAGTPVISTSDTIYHSGQNIAVSYQSGPGNSKDWIGIYKTGYVPGSNPSTDWKYVNGTSGTIDLSVTEPGSYFIAFFEEDGYVELADRLTVFIIISPVLSLNKAGFDADEEIKVSYSHAPGSSSDWIGVYRLADIPGQAGSISWNYVSGAQGSLSFTGLPSGYYFVTYFLEGGYTEACDRIIFSVGNDLAEVNVDKPIYKPGEPIRVTYGNGPGTQADWIGILIQDAPPGTAPLVSRQFLNGQQSGLINFNLNLEPGSYYASLFINNSAVRISNKDIFSVESITGEKDQNSTRNDFILFPSPASGKFRIKTRDRHERMLSVGIISLTGTSILEKQVEISPGEDSKEIDVSGIPKGIYIISIHTGNKISVSKLVLQ